ncbi:nucleotide sugar dehydrogenase [Luteolibacter sp. SL250]|uniref:nucleotide sugar dehydrogenase n=1 Tax=Luteolibacter sp. SL250 TaxID=2995170 RepID=UPI00226E8216|nr:nucleotide sugar dehydrogenase [Luteolibacter sp. SL250]WAC19637.1 nucleotide sugar dehydrogenase [Luteolibacter sp. SL250]
MQSDASPKEQFSISVFGLGYVGSVVAALLASRGHKVIGVDVIQSKVDAMNAGEATFHEPGLAELTSGAHRAKLLRATTDTAEAIAGTDISLVCVGTPSTAAGSLDLAFVEEVTGNIGAALRAKSTRHHLIYRSTMLPGSTRGLVDTHLKDLVDDLKLQVFFYPEFLRQGTAVKDMIEPSLSVVGSYDPEVDISAIRKIFDASTEQTDLESAELIKYACNAFHAAKVSFANEIGRISKGIGVDAVNVMRVICQDTRLNISPYYLRPGTPFGGSCLPKDVSALNHLSRSRALSTPMLDSLLASNEDHMDHLTEMVETAASPRVLLLGLSFKEQTDDLRGSAAFELATRLLLKNYDVGIYDPLIVPANFTGAVGRIASLRLPNLTSLLKSDLAAALREKDTIVVFNRCADVSHLAEHLAPRHKIIDVASWPELASLSASYTGICW